MNKPWESDSCESVKAYYSFYYVPKAAALWCGVPEEMVDIILKEATHNKNIWTHPKISCLTPRCKAIHDAIDNDQLRCGRDGNGRYLNSEPGGGVAREKRTVSRPDLKEWIAREFPSDKPPFLFDEVERTTHSAINADSFRALQADRDALQRQLKHAKDETSKMELEKYKHIALIQELEDKLKRPKPAVDPRAEKTYLTMIGALLEIAAGIYKHERFDSQNHLIDFLVEKNGELRGISPRTLAAKFADANKALEGIFD